MKNAEDSKTKKQKDFYPTPRSITNKLIMNVDFKEIKTSLMSTCFNSIKTIIQYFHLPPECQDQALPIFPHQHILQYPYIPFLQNQAFPSPS